MRSHWNFYGAGQLTFGSKAIEQLRAIVERHGWRRLLLVTDQTLVNVGVASRVREVLNFPGCKLETFDGGEAEPTVEVALASVSVAREFQPDAIIGLGGGSNMDLAKVTATVSGHGGSPHDYFGFDRVPGPVQPLVCIPTTAGTGSEVSHAAVLTDRENAMKVSCLSNWLRPTVAIVDPDLTYSCPRRVTADSGIDALTHAIEGYTATDFRDLDVPAGEACAYEGRFPLGSLIAEEAIRLVGCHLVTAVNEPTNKAAREGMALASTLAGLAFSNCGVALVHALEYPLGGELHCSHGAGNGMLLPFVMRFNRPERIPAFARIASLLGRDVSNLSVEEAAEEAIRAVEDLRRAIGIPASIRELGGTAEQLPRFAEKAFQIKRLLWVNPRRASQADLLEILESAY